MALRSSTLALLAACVVSCSSSSSEETCPTGVGDCGPGELAVNVAHTDGKALTIDARYGIVVDVVAPSGITNTQRFHCTVDDGIASYTRCQEEPSTSNYQLFDVRLTAHQLVLYVESGDYAAIGVTLEDGEGHVVAVKSFTPHPIKLQCCRTFEPDSWTIP